VAGSKFSFIHCADLHLDSPFEGLQQVAPALARLLRDPTFQAFDQVINLALEHRVDFIIVAGDVYDGADRSLRAQLRFRDALARAAWGVLRRGRPCHDQSNWALRLNYYSYSWEPKIPGRDSYTPQSVLSEWKLFDLSTMKLGRECRQALRYSYDEYISTPNVLKGGDIVLLNTSQ